MFRTDKHRNPAAVTTDVARQSGLAEGVDWERGDKFPDPSNLYTALFLKDPIETTIKIIDALGFRTKAGAGRWTYINMPKFVWDALSPRLKIKVVGDMYAHEGGTEMKALFPAA